MGIRVTVYRPADRLGDCTLGGVSSRAAFLTITNVDGPFEPTEDAPAALLVAGRVSYVARIVPADAGDRWTAFGGNYAGSSEARFSDAVSALTGLPFHGVVAVHDRIEA